MIFLEIDSGERMTIRDKLIDWGDLDDFYSNANAQIAAYLYNRFWLAYPSLQNEYNRGVLLSFGEEDDARRISSLLEDRQRILKFINGDFDLESNGFLPSLWGLVNGVDMEGISYDGVTGSQSYNNRMSLDMLLGRLVLAYYYVEDDKKQDFRKKMSSFITKMYETIGLDIYTADDITNGVEMCIESMSIVEPKISDNVREIIGKIGKDDIKTERARFGLLMNAKILAKNGLYGPKPSMN